MTGRYPGLAGLEEERPSLEGRGVVVTGGSRGIGLACATEVLAAGGRVVLAARGEGELAETTEELAGKFGADRVLGVPTDVGREGDVARLFAEAEGVLGGVDGVVHAAGVLGPIGPTAEVDPSAWLDAVRVNLFGSFLVSTAAARAMSASRGGSIVLLSGGGATSPFPRYTAYAAGKVGVVRLAESLAEELAPLGIRVNALAPGFVATRIHEGTLAAGERAGGDYLRRTWEELEEGGVPAELAGRAAVFLLSDRAAWITGRLVSAPWDRWWEWPERRGEIEGSDLFTLRRIVPRDRGGDWQ